GARRALVARASRDRCPHPRSPAARAVPGGARAGRRAAARFRRRRRALVRRRGRFPPGAGQRGVAGSDPRRGELPGPADHGVPGHRGADDPRAPGALTGARSGVPRPERRCRLPGRVLRSAPRTMTAPRSPAEAVVSPSTPAERSAAVFPGASLGEYDLPPEMAVVLARGEGAAVWDAAGRRFADFTMGWGSVLLGHAHPAIVEAVRRQAALGSNFAYVSAPALELAEEVQRALPCAERLRFCASGTEAMAYAVRLARAWTGRPRLLKFEGAYHGANEIGTVSLFPARLHAFPQGEPTSAGLPSSAVADVLVAPFNDLATTEAIVTAHRDELAAIVVEPLHRCTSPRPGFLEGLRRLATATGSLLVFDETVTGFRLAYGGAQAYYGVRPDLCALGKALGGGYPLGAVAGRADVLELVREDRLGDPRYVWFASSLGGNPVSAAAGLAALG